MKSDHGVPMPSGEVDTPPECTQCGSIEGLHMTRFGWVCDGCIMAKSDEQDEAQVQVERREHDREI